MSCVSWKSARQTTVSLHTAQAELIAVSEGIKESEWFLLKKNLGFQRDENFITCWCGNMAAISIVKDPASHSSTKQIETKFLYSREVHEKRRIVI